MICDHCGLRCLGEHDRAAMEIPKRPPATCRGPHCSAPVPCGWLQLIACGDESVSVGIQVRGERPGSHKRARQARHARENRRGTNLEATMTGNDYGVWSRFQESSGSVEQESRESVGDAACAAGLC